VTDFCLGVPSVKRRSKKPAFVPKRAPVFIYDEGIRAKLKPEEDLQVQCVNVIREAAPHLRVFHIANQGERTKVAKIILKAMGMDKGAVDLCVIGRDKFCAFAEVKVPGDYLTPEQEHFMEEAQRFGFPCGVLRVARDAYNFLLASGAPGPIHLPARFRQMRLPLMVA
jgi:hypothetical protein